MRWIKGCVVVALIGASALAAQTVPVINRGLIVLDPAHGGQDTGARINDQMNEKDVTLQMALRLRSLLNARGFTVVASREEDAGATLDKRAEAANKSHAVACVVIHASASGNGVYVGTSAIGSAMAEVPASNSTQKMPIGVIPWDRAQEVYLPQSLKLASEVGTALARSNLPVALGRAAVRPLDNLMCPAITIEIATLRGSETTPVSDAGYQQRVADAIAGALVLWRNQAEQPEYIPVPRPTGSGL